MIPHPVLNTPPAMRTLFSSASVMKTTRQGPMVPVVCGLSDLRSKPISLPI